MITVEDKHNLVNIAVMGEFTLADFKHFEDHVRYKLTSPGDVNILLDLRGMLSYTADVAWEEIKFFQTEESMSLNKIAVVTDDQWITWQVWLSRLFIDTDIRVFPDYKNAVAWVNT